MSGMYGISMSPYFFPSSLRILTRTYSDWRKFVSSCHCTQSRMTAEAPGAKATDFIASSSAVAARLAGKQRKRGNEQKGGNGRQTDVFHGTDLSDSDCAA